MANNVIEVFKGTTKTILVTVTGLESLSGYSGTLTVKTDLDASTESISVTHDSIDGLVMTFKTTADHNDLAAGHYVYYVEITDGTNVHPVRQDKYIIHKKAKN